MSGEGFNNPVIGGDGSLIIDTIKSSNYVLNVSGWAINKDGSFQLGPNGTIEGSVNVQSSDGSAVIIAPNNGGQVQFVPNTGSFPGVTENLPGNIFSNIASGGGGAHYTYMTLSTPQITDSKGTVPQANMELLSKRTDGAAYPGFSVANALFEVGADLQLMGQALLQSNAHIQGSLTVDLGTTLAALTASGTATFNGTLQANAAASFGANVQVGGTLSNGNTSPYLAGQAGSVNMSFTSLGSSTVAVTFTTPFAPGVTPIVTTNINNGAGATSQWHSRAINVTNTGFTMFVFAPSGTSTWSNVNVQWSAVTPT